MVSPTWTKGMLRRRFSWNPSASREGDGLAVECIGVHHEWQAAESAGGGGEEVGEGFSGFVGAAAGGAEQGGTGFDPLTVGAPFYGGGEDVGGVRSGGEGGLSFGGIEGWPVEGVVGGIAEEGGEGGEFRDLEVVEGDAADFEDGGLPAAGGDVFFLGGAVGHGALPVMERKGSSPSSAMAWARARRRRRPVARRKAPPLAALACWPRL